MLDILTQLFVVMNEINLNEIWQSTMTVSPLISGFGDDITMIGNKDNVNHWTLPCLPLLQY